ncbi:hypothetical protein F383_26544 [Gossypium arboreum]|uniref:Uncharacterized protein n=1 Tax=Gossypium arboreum TaxID=29729 RepID=A0A0B0PCG1_GOSAR|nr:hypothetical protein F383_26544 [Gossypium arboreum]
MREVRRSVYFK